LSIGKAILIKPVDGSGLAAGYTSNLLARCITKAVVSILGAQLKIALQ
jgi:hypothetical protein